MNKQAEGDGEGRKHSFFTLVVRRNRKTSALLLKSSMRRDRIATEVEPSILSSRGRGSL